MTIKISMIKIMSQIHKNVSSKKWKCIIDGCNNEAINSHLLQKNGILNSVADDNHIVELKEKDFFKWDSKSPPIRMQRIGINKAFSLPVFCGIHDTSIFKSIETQSINFEEYKSQLLLSYRVICAEIRKKEINVEIDTRLLNSNLLRGYIDSKSINTFLRGTELGILNLTVFKNIFENELRINNSLFVFKTYKYPLIKIYGSAIFSPLEKPLPSPEQIEPLKSVFIHVIPYNDRLWIITGYHKDYTSNWIVKYVNDWADLDKNQLELKLSNLFAARIENWGINPTLFNNIPTHTINAFLKYWEENALNLSSQQEPKFNLFENI